MTREDAEDLVKRNGAFGMYGRTWSARKVIEDKGEVYLVAQHERVSLRVPIDLVILTYVGTEV